MMKSKTGGGDENSDESSVRRRGGLIIARVRHSWEQALFSLPQPSIRPLIGTPGVSVFQPYTPSPPQPQPQQTGAAVAGIGGGRKRVRESSSSNTNNNNQNNNVPQRCSVCSKVFASAKALFGHMRSHPDRGWKGVHPPPAFRAEDEFADLRTAKEETQGDAGEGTSYRVPDLNHPPPPDAT